MNTLYPGVLQQIADATSAEVAETLAREVGGTEIFVPRYPRAGGMLVQLIGLSNATAIAQKIGWGKLLIPAGDFRGQGSRRRMVERLTAEGFSTQEIARMVDCHERTVRRTKERLRSEAQQLRLPGV